ncbi:MAG: hypothetical protein D6797_00790 [Bdellovibrio sp.]|nr:MAG: hypothetical protein D6797_00790 [Bdellovibrio sp.]
MDSQKNTSHKDTSLKHLQFIENQNNCALCGSVLEIHVESLLEDSTIKEEAYCPHCQLKTRVKHHKCH